MLWRHFWRFTTVDLNVVVHVIWFSLIVFSSLSIVYFNHAWKLLAIFWSNYKKKMLCYCQAGASSMWASCCGLLNEVMGTGAVRGQQPGFGAGAGPFRFAPSAGYSTYPPTGSGSLSPVCKSCAQAFSVFRRKVGGQFLMILKALYP